MSTIRELHDKAMRLADEVMVMRHAGAWADVVEWAAKAMEFEEQAARMLEPTTRHEPSRSILFRSAASLALSAGKVQKAIELAYEGQKTCINDDIRRELEDVARTAYEIRAAMMVEMRMMTNGQQPWHKSLRAVLANDVLHTTDDIPIEAIWAEYYPPKPDSLKDLIPPADPA